MTQLRIREPEAKKDRREVITDPIVLELATLNVSDLDCYLRTKMREEGGAEEVVVAVCKLLSVWMREE